MFQISYVIPLFNEALVFDKLIERLDNLMNKTDLQIEVVLVDDGSSDGTALKMRQLALADARFHCVFLSRNFGHQFALTAGLSVAQATEAVLILDGDLQDPPELITEFYTYYQKGYDVIFGIRKKRKEGILKRFAYYLFYRIMRSISYTDIPLDSGDFSMISRRALNVLNQMPEQSRFVRGMRTWIGFKQIGVEYERQGRHAGESKYSFSMLRKLAYNGIFNFSELPIKFIGYLGVLTISIALLFLAITIFKKMYYHSVPEGFTALLFTIILFSGVQLLSLSIIGSYILRIFFQVKNRPNFIIQEQIINKQLISE